MFYNIFMYEIRNNLKKISTYSYSLVLFLIGFLTIIATGGKLEGVSVNISGFGAKVFLNAPLMNMVIIQGISLMGIFLVAAIMGSSIYRDFESKSYAIFYSKPLSKFSFLFGRFTANIVVLTFIHLGIGLGLLLGSLTPWIDKALFGKVIISSYFTPYFFVIIPNIILSGAIFFSIATLTRKIYPVYISGLVLFLGYFIAQYLIGRMDWKFLAALLDPFAGNAVRHIVRLWSIAEFRSKAVPFSGAFLYNRLIWLAVSFIILLFSYKKFNFSYFLNDKKRGILKKQKIKSIVSDENIVVQIPNAKQIFSFNTDLKQFFTLTKLYFFSILKSINFIIISILGIILTLIAINSSGEMYGTTTYPVTRMIISSLEGSYTLLITIIITIYAGELIWKERYSKSDLIYDSLPTKSISYFTAKLFSLVGIQITLLAIVMFFGIVYQLVNGYTSLELGLYIKAFFGLNLLRFTLLTIIIFFIHTIVNHKYIGHFIVIMFHFVISFLPGIGLDHKLFYYNYGLTIPYSDMNSYGHFLKPYLWYMFYWALFCSILFIISKNIWVRGKEINLKFRFNAFLKNFNFNEKLITSFIIVLFLLSGSYIFYNTNILNRYLSKKSMDNIQVQYEKKYKKYEKTPQPKITSSKVYVDMYPKDRSVDIKGTYTLKNKTESAIDSIIIQYNDETIVKKSEFSKHSDLSHYDKNYGLYVYKLSHPLQAGDSLNYTYDISYENNGFRNSGEDNRFCYNGTFFHSAGILPSLGYESSQEISSDKKRRKYNLEPKERFPDVNDKEARMNNCLSDDADWISYEAILSTEADQIALTVGDLISEKTENGRRIFHYKMNGKVLNYFPYISAKYQLKKDKLIRSNGEEVAIEIYYDEKHPFNLDNMINSAKKSIAYYDKNFTPYPHKILRIAEFPRYQSFAQSFPTLIPYSESIGFIADVNKGNINYPFWVTAHEIGHHYWAHRVIGANVKGSIFLSEGLTQYSSFMVMKHFFSAEKMRDMLNRDLNNYLMGRGREIKKENPIYLEENQPYIHYYKGSFTMFSLADYIGEENVNSILKKFLEDKGYQEPPYTNSLEFLSYLDKAVPDSLKYLIDDMFMNITLYANQTQEAKYKQLDNGFYQVELKVEVNKIRSDSMGVETDIDFNDWIEVGIFSEDENHELVELYLEKHMFNEKENILTFIVESEPKKAGIDPYYKLVDRNTSNNIKNVEKMDDGDLASTR